MRVKHYIFQSLIYFRKYGDGSSGNIFNRFVRAGGGAPQHIRPRGAYEIDRCARLDAVNVELGLRPRARNSHHRHEDLSAIQGLDEFGVGRGLRPRARNSHQKNETVLKKYKPIMS